MKEGGTSEARESKESPLSLVEAEESLNWTYMAPLVHYCFNPSDKLEWKERSWTVGVVLMDWEEVDWE